eukprot:2918480-Rhodomonas_salina.1
MRFSAFVFCSVSHIAHCRGGIESKLISVPGQFVLGMPYPAFDFAVWRRSVSTAYARHDRVLMAKSHHGMRRKSEGKRKEPGGAQWYVCPHLSRALSGVNR